MLIFKPIMTSFQKSHRLEEVPQRNPSLLSLKTRQVFPQPVWSQTDIHSDREEDIKTVWWGKKRRKYPSSV